MTIDLVLILLLFAGKLPVVAFRPPLRFERIALTLRFECLLASDLSPVRSRRVISSLLLTPICLPIALSSLTLVFHRRSLLPLTLLPPLLLTLGVAPLVLLLTLGMTHLLLLSALIVPLLLLTLCLAHLLLPLALIVPLLLTLLSLGMLHLPLLLLGMLYLPLLLLSLGVLHLPLLLLLLSLDVLHLPLLSLGVLHLPLLLLLLLALDVLHLPLLLALGVLHLPLLLLLLLALGMLDLPLLLSAAGALLMARGATAAAISTALAFPLRERRSGKKHRDREN